MKTTMVHKSIIRKYSMVLIVTLNCFATSTAVADEPAAAHTSESPREFIDLSSGRTNWLVRLPKESKITYKGAVNFDGLGGQAGAMMYPAPNALGLIAAILTHAAISESSKNSEKEKLQTQADKVLDPYRSTLDGYSAQELVQASIALVPKHIGLRSIDPTINSEAGWTLDVLPVFSLTQDQSALILECTIVKTPPGTNVEGKSESIVRVVSFPIEEKDPAQAWLAEQGARIKRESAGLLAQALLIALNEPTGAKMPSTAFKTVHYLEGKSEKVERAQIINEQCQRITIRNLRGTLMSVPGKPPLNESNRQCEG